ncbi:hypothetical protein Ancab_025392 [Ancistrocladus abbreviatus]
MATSVKSLCILCTFSLCLNLSVARRAHLEEMSAIGGNSHAAYTVRHETSLITKQGDKIGDKLKQDDLDHPIASFGKKNQGSLDDHDLGFDETHDHDGYGYRYYNRADVLQHRWCGGIQYCPPHTSGPFYDSGPTPCHPPPPLVDCSSYSHEWGHTTDDGAYEEEYLDGQHRVATTGKTTGTAQKKFSEIKPRNVLTSRAAVTTNHVDSLGPKPHVHKKVPLS